MRKQETLRQGVGLSVIFSSCFLLYFPNVGRQSLLLCRNNKRCIVFPNICGKSPLLCRNKKRCIVRWACLSNVIILRMISSKVSFYIFLLVFFASFCLKKGILVYRYLFKKYFVPVSRLQTGLIKN